MSPIIGPRGGAESSAGTTGLHTFVIWRETAILTLLLIWGLFLRLPFFFPPTIDDDESTFTIVGQGILDGLLPYDALWENKPPLVFLFFAVTMSLLGKTIIAIRFGSYLWLTAAAYLTYKSAYVLTSEERKYSRSNPVNYGEFAKVTWCDFGVARLDSPNWCSIHASQEPKNQ